MNEEKKKQDGFTWARSSNYAMYNRILGQYQVRTCIEQSPGDSILDMPCGDGTLTAMFAENYDRVVGLDASKHHLEQARQKVPGAEFHEALIEEFETEERFDVVAMLNILEHVVDPVLILKKASVFLKKHGRIHVQVPNAYAINRRLAVLMGTLESCEELSPFDIKIAGHRRSYDTKTLLRDIKEAGLEALDSGGIFYKILSTPQMDWFLENGLWEEGGFGWGRIGADTKDWRAEFCRASYELGKQHPEDCNVIWVSATKK